jgi:hypothetical protein
MEIFTIIEIHYIDSFNGFTPPLLSKITDSLEMDLKSKLSKKE